MAFVLRWGCDRWRGRLVIAGMLVMLIACSAVVGVCGTERGVMLDVRDARLVDVVLLLTQQSGASICINDPDVADKRVTAVMYDKPLEAVLEYVVKNTAGVDFWKTPDGTYIIGGKRPEPEAKPTSVEPIVTSPEKPANPTHTEVIKLVNSDPYELLISIGVLAPEDNPNHTFLGLRSGGVLGVLDEDRMQVGMRVPGNPRGYQEAGGVKLDTVPPAIDPGNKTAAGEAGRAAAPGEGSAQGGYRPPSTPGGPGYPGGTRPPGAPAGGTTTGAGNLLPEGVVLVQPFSLDNSIIVKGTDDGITEFKELVHMLDIPPKQVSIKAEFIEVSTNDVKRLGIDWSLERLNLTINTNFNPAGNVVVGVTTGNLAASLRAELTRSSGNIINSPIISTINNEFAEISIGSQIPYWTTVLTNLGIGQVVSQQIVNSLNVTTYLRVLPRVNGDGTITLTLMPSVQDTGRIFTDPTGKSEIPETRFQTLYTRRRVMNGETIVVGGFIRKDKSTSTTQIPILGSLPIIGPLFRSTSTTSQDRELLIFVTPTIIGEKSAGSSVGVSSTYP